MLPNLYRQKLGKIGEKTAQHFLQKKGLQLIQSNYLIRGGQIDLIMRNKLNQKWHFIEVKSRMSSYSTSDFLLSKKQLFTLRRTAAYFLQTKSPEKLPAWQFDLVWLHFSYQSIDHKPILKAKIKYLPDVLLT